MNIRLDLIQPSPQPVRTSWDEEKMAELIESIRERGVIAPIKVRPINGRYEIVYGHRRFEACRRLALAEIPVIVGELESDDALVEQIIENELREDMPYLEQAQSFQRIMDRKGWSQRALGQKTGISEYRIRTAIQWLAARAVGAAVEVRGATHLTGQGPGVESTLEIARVLGSDVDARQLVARKVGEEELGQHDAHRVAEAYKAAEDEIERQAVLDTPYRDPDFTRLVRAKTHVRHQVAREQQQKRQEDPHEVRVYLDIMRAYAAAVREAIAVAEYGKFSPEAGRFVKGWHDSIRGLMTQLESALEVQDA